MKNFFCLGLEVRRGETSDQTCPPVRGAELLTFASSFAPPTKIPQTQEPVCPKFARHRAVRRRSIDGGALAVTFEFSCRPTSSFHRHCLIFSADPQTASRRGPHVLAVKSLLGVIVSRKCLVFEMHARVS